MEDKQIESGNNNITNSLKIFAAETPDKEFLFDLNQNLGLTYKECNSLVNSICTYFKTLGLKKGDIVSIYLDNSLEFCLLFLASLRYGTIMFPYPKIFSKAELKRDINLSKPKIVFMQKEKSDDFLEVSFSRLIYINGEKQSFLRDIMKYEDSFEAENIGPEEIACLFHSSGTSLHPRGILYSQKNIMALIPSVCRGFNFCSNDIHLIVLPLAHSAALNYSLFPALYKGGTVILADSFWNIKNRFWRICDIYQITYIEVVPTILYMLCNLPFEKSEITSLNYIGCGSAPLSEELQMKFERTFNLPVANLYGLTETGPTHVDHPLGPNWKRGTIGKALDVNDIRIIDEEGNELPYGRTGEIAVKGENVFPGYAFNSKLAFRYFKKGYFCTGDIGYQDEKGYFYFCSRKKDLIIRGGVNIHPDEINELLLKHPGVEKSVTVGEPDEFFGELIKCFVVLKEGNDSDEKALINYCSCYLSPIKVPDFINIVPEISNYPAQN